MGALTDIRAQMAGDASVLAGAILAIYYQQTSGEREAHGTYFQNGVGFNATDAGFGTSLAKQIQEQSSLTPKQVMAGQKMMAKYAGQIFRLGHTGDTLRALAGQITVRNGQQVRVLTLPDGDTDLEEII